MPQLAAVSLSKRLSIPELYSRVTDLPSGRVTVMVCVKNQSLLEIEHKESEIQIASNLKLDGLKTVDAEFEFPQLKMSQPLNILSVSDSLMIAKLNVDLAKYYDGKNKDALFAAISNFASNKSFMIKPSFENFAHEKNDWVSVAKRQ